MDQLFFSVVIPTLNEEEYIGRLLDDLVKQKAKDFEVFVVDCGSNDKTQQIVDSYKSKLNLKLLLSDIKNVSHQRNLGANDAIGKYLVFLDADVQMTKQYLYMLKNHLERKYVSFATTYVIPDSKVVYDKIITTGNNILSELSLLIDKPFIGGWNMIVDRIVFQRIGGFDKKVIHGEDWDLSIRLHEAGYKMKIFKKPTIIYSLRRFRKEGRIVSLRKHTQAAIHNLTKGPITKEIFKYPMGGEWYKLALEKKQQKPFIKQVKLYIRKFRKWMEE